VQVNAGGLLTAAGWRPHGQQIVRYREAVAGPPGVVFAALTEATVQKGFRIDGDRLATRPRGFAPGHPREELLRHKTLFARRDHGCPNWLSTPEVVDRVRDDWRELRPLVQWLADHVGPGDQPGERAR
jgi:uncharacterized protein (DUF2461 family)